MHWGGVIEVPSCWQQVQLILGSQSYGKLKESKAWVDREIKEDGHFEFSENYLGLKRDDKVICKN